MYIYMHKSKKKNNKLRYNSMNTLVQFQYLFCYAYLLLANKFYDEKKIFSEKR